MILAAGLGRQASGTAADAAPSPSWTPNPADAGSNLTVSGYKITSTSGTGSRGVRGTVSQSSGIFLASFWPDSAGGNWVNGADFIGLANASQSLSTYLGSSGGNSIGIRVSGQLIYNDVNGSTLAPWRVGARIDIAFVFASKKAYFRVGMGLWNDSDTATPLTDTGGIPTSSMSGAVFPAVSFETNGVICRTAAIDFSASGAVAPWSA